MKQEGGTRASGARASFDVKATPFGAYDAAFIEAVTQRGMICWTAGNSRWTAPAR
jgi:hypothetical protein